MYAIIGLPDPIAVRRQSMKRLALLLGLCLLLFLATRSTHAQDSNPATDDASAVHATVRNYIEGYYRGDAGRMAQTLPPHYLKHMIHGSSPMREKTGQEMLREVRSHGPADLPEADKTEQISVLDVAGNIASAKLVTPGWVDYLTLEKSEGKWKILSVVQRIDN
jgi:hypothetical protein